MEYKFTSPLAVYLPRVTKKDRKMILNKNNERNWHFIVNNQVKVAYKEAMESQLKPARVIETRVFISLTYYKPTKRRSDRSNVLCIHEKFFCDALVEAGWLGDDNDDIIIWTTYQGSELDRKNPRVEITVTELPPRSSSPENQGSLSLY